MKRLNQNGFELTVLLLAVAIVLTVGFAGWLVIKRSNEQSQTSTTTVQINNDCGGNRECFYQAFSGNCTPKTIKITNTTIEGDIIVTSAKIAQGFEGCVVNVTVDGSKDKLGDGKVHSYDCEKLAQESQTLTASVCTGSIENSSVTI